MADWTMIRMHYEVLGEDVQELSRSHHVSVNLINRAIQKEGWARTKIANSVKGWSGDEETLVEDVRTKANVLNTFRAAGMGPALLKAQMSILNKINDVVEELMPGDPDAPKAIKALVDSIAELMPASLKEQPAALGGEGGLTVNIVGGYGRDLPLNDTEVVIDIPQPGVTTHPADRMISE